MTKKLLALIMGAMLFAAGCGGGSGAMPTPSPSAPSAPSYDAAYEESVENEQGDSEELPKSADAGRMIIKNAYMEIESDDSNALYSGIIHFTKAINGYESSYNIDNYETYSVIHAEIRVPSERFDELTGFITKNSTVINNQMSSQDITDDYYDVKTRLETKRATLQTYYNLLEKASSVEEIIQLQRTIDEITIDLEAMEGRLRLWSSQVSMSTVSLLIRQHNDPVKIRKDINWNALSISDMGYLIKRGFIGTLDIVAVILQWLVIAASSLSPVIAILVIIYFVLKKMGKRITLRRRKPRSGAKEKDTAAPQAEPAAESVDDNK